MITTTHRERITERAQRGYRVQGGFGVLPQAMQDLCVSRLPAEGQLIAPDLQLWLYLADQYYIDPKNPRWMPSQREISAALGWGQGRVVAAIKRLEAAGALHRGTQSGSSSWVGAELYVIDYVPRARRMREPESAPCTPKRTGTVAGPDDYPEADALAQRPQNISFFGSERFDFRIASDPKIESQMPAYPLTPKESTLTYLAESTLTSPVVAEEMDMSEGVISQGEEMINQGESEQTEDVITEQTEESQTETIPCSTPDHTKRLSPLARACLDRLTAYGISQAGAFAAIAAMQRNGQLTEERIEAILSYTDAIPASSIRQSRQGLAQQLLSDPTFRPRSKRETPNGHMLRHPHEAYQAQGSMPAAPSPHAATWAAVCETLGTTLGASEFVTWIKPCAIVEVKDGVVVVAAPNIFVRQELEANYIEPLRSACVDVLGQDVQLEIVIGGPACF